MVSTHYFVKKCENRLKYLGNPWCFWTPSAVCEKALKTNGNNKFLGPGNTVQKPFEKQCQICWIRWICWNWWNPNCWTNDCWTNLTVKFDCQICPTKFCWTNICWTNLLNKFVEQKFVEQMIGFVQNQPTVEQMCSRWNLVDFVNKWWI